MKKVLMRNHDVPQPGKGCNRYEILVVDDNPDTLLLLEEILQKEGYSVTCKESGKESLEAAKSGNFDLILLDILMPEMDGFEVCRQLKENPKTKDIPVIFLTIADDPEYIIQGLNFGAVAYITKPFTKYEIVAIIRPHVQLYRMKKILLRHLKEYSNDDAEKISGLVDDLVKCLEVER